MARMTSRMTKKPRRPITSVCGVPVRVEGKGLWFGDFPYGCVTVSRTGYLAQGKQFGQGLIRKLTWEAKIIVGSGSERFDRIVFRHQAPTPQRAVAGLEKTVLEWLPTKPWLVTRMTSGEEATK